MRKMKPVSPNIWNSEDFHALSSNGKVVWFHLITGSHANQGVPGLFRGTCESLRIETRMGRKAHTAAFNEIVRRGMMVRDESLGVVWLPQAVRWNLPTTHTEIRAWAEGLNHLPYCKVVDRARTKVVIVLYKYRSLGFSEQAWAVWQEVYGDRLSGVTLDEILNDGSPGKDSEESDTIEEVGNVPGPVRPGVDGSGRASSLSRASNNVRARGSGRAAPVSLSLSDSGSGSDSGFSGAACARDREGMSQDVADVIQVWLDDVCAAMEVKPKVAQAHIDRVQGLLDARVPKETLVLALRGAAEDRYVQGTKPGSPKGGKRDLLWLFRTLDAIQTFATDGAALAPPAQRTWVTPADLFAIKAAQTESQIAPANQAGFRKLMDILAKPPPLLPGVPAKAAIHASATGVQATSGNDVPGPTPSKGETTSTLGQTPQSVVTEDVLRWWAGELERVQEEDREAMLEVFLDTYKVPFPREKLSGTTVPRVDDKETT